MCHYITATLPPGADLTSVAAIFKDCKFGFGLIENAHVIAQLPAGSSYVLTTRKHCDCGTVLGSMAHAVEATPGSLDRDLERLRRQGWSEAKIQRWVAEKKAAREKDERKAQHEAERGTPGAKPWIDLLSAVLASGATKQLGILLHRYKGGGVANERIGLKDAITTRLVEVTPEFLMTMKEDVLYNFTP
jgi:hypothetical protein